MTRGLLVAVQSASTAEGTPITRTKAEYRNGAAIEGRGPEARGLPKVAWEGQVAPE